MIKINDRIKDFNRENEGLKGKVKSIHTKVAEEIEDVKEGKKEPYLSEYVLYTENGDKLEYSIYSIDKTICQQQIFIYNALGCQRQWVYYKKDNTAGETYTYFYDLKGNLVKETIYDAVFSFLYNSENELIESSCHEDNVFEHRSVYEYNKLENTVSKVCFKIDNIPYTELIYKFDEKDNLVELLDYESKEKMVYLYDEKGHRIRFSLYKNYGLLEYDQVYILDKGGNIVKETQYDLYPDQVINKERNYSYDFDLFGNWIKKECTTLTDDNKGFHKSYRTEHRYITYY